MSNPGSSRRNRTGTGIHLRSDSEDSTDLAALLYELELASTEEASTANNLQRLTPLEPGGTTSAAAAMEAVLDRQRRLELMQLRMRLIFGTDIPLEETAARIDNNNNSDLPPPIPADASSLATGAQQRTSSGNRGTPRRIELRQARNSPGQRVNYTIDPDFEMEESDDEDAGGGRNTTAAAPLRTQIAAAGNGSLLHSDHQGASEGESSSEETGETDPQPALDAAALAIRNLLRFGSPDEINGAADSIPRTAGVAGDPRLQLQQSAESRRQRARLARMTQRAEEEANLNRAILMSLQETQTPERGRRANEEATPGTCAALADSAAGTREIDEADVAMLVSMGFTREQSVQALVENRHSVELAANRLLGIDF